MLDANQGLHFGGREREASAILESQARIQNNEERLPFLQMLHRGLFIDSEKEMCFPSCNFCLKKRPGEPAQFKTRLQFGRAQQLVRINPQLSFTHKDLGT
jgi:hypothetical protein